MAAVPSVEMDLDTSAGDALPPATSAKPLTPPVSEDLDKHEASSELSELDVEEPKMEEDDDDIGEVEPAYYYDDGKIPVFEPVRTHSRLQTYRTASLESQSFGCQLQGVYTNT
jgi:hypothetical protein